MLRRRQVVNLVTWDALKVWFHAFSVKSDQGSPTRPKGIPVYVIFPVPPSLVMTGVKEKPLSYILIDISLLPTFHFLPPPYIFAPICLSSVILLLIMYLPLTVGLVGKAKTLQVRLTSGPGSHFFVHLLAFLLEYDVKLSNFTFKGGRK